MSARDEIVDRWADPGLAAAPQSVSSKAQTPLADTRRETGLKPGQCLR